MSEYPEHEKLKSLGGANQIVGDFIGRLGEQDLVIAEWANGSELMPIRRSLNDLLADHFKIDQNKLEAEKRAMIEKLRAA